MSHAAGLRADIEWNANTGVAKSELGELGQLYHRTTGAMSDDALRLAVAQEKLNRTISRSGPESTAAKQATLNYRRELAALTGDATRAGVAVGRADRQMEHFGRGALVGSGALRGLGRSAIYASSSFLGGAGLLFALRASSGAASNLNEQTSKTKVVFGDAAGGVIAYANDALGLARDTALEAASSFGALLRPLGILPGEAAKLSTQMAQLGVDFASFYNTPTADALAAIKSGLVGESEPLRRYGVLLSEARVQKEALRETGKTTAEQLTNEEKVLARVALILKDSGQAAGDYERTIGGLANQQRELDKNTRNLEIGIGQALNPTILDVTKSMNDWLGDTENQARVQRDLTDAIRDAKAVARDFANVADTVAEGVGGWRIAIELLIGLKVASVLGGWTRNIGSLGRVLTGAAGGASGDAGAGLLLSRMAALKALGPITLTVLIAYKTINDPGSIIDRGKAITSPDLPQPVKDALYGLPVVGGVLKGVTDVRNATRGQPEGPAQATVGSQGLRDSLLGRQRRGPFGTLTGGLEPKPVTHDGGGGSSGSAGTFAPIGRDSRISLAVSAARTAVARGDSGAENELVQALLQQVNAARTGERLQQRLVDDQTRSVKERQKHADLLQRLQGEEAAALSEIQGIEDDRNKTVADAAEKRVKATKDAADKERKAAEDEKRIAAERVRTAYSNQEQALQNRLARAQLTEKNVNDDRAANQKLLQLYLRQEHDQKLTYEERLQATSQEIAVRKAIQDLDKKRADATADANQVAGALQREVLAALQDIVTKFQGNVREGAGAQVTVNQNFPHAPTHPPHREAIFARHMYEAAFDGI